MPGSGLRLFSLISQHELPMRTKEIRNMTMKDHFRASSVVSKRGFLSTASVMRGQAMPPNEEPDTARPRATALLLMNQPLIAFTAG